MTAGQMASMLAMEMRHVALPDKLPERVVIVMEYGGAVMRYEFMPNGEALALREVRGE